MQEMQNYDEAYYLSGSKRLFPVDKGLIKSFIDVGL